MVSNIVDKIVYKIDGNTSLVLKLFEETGNLYLGDLGRRFETFDEYLKFRDYEKIRFGIFNSFRINDFNTRGNRYRSNISKIIGSLWHTSISIGIVYSCL